MLVGLHRVLRSHHTDFIKPRNKTGWRRFLLHEGTYNESRLKNSPLKNICAETVFGAKNKKTFIPCFQHIIYETFAIKDKWWYNSMLTLKAQCWNKSLILMRQNFEASVQMIVSIVQKASIWMLQKKNVIIKVITFGRQLNESY